MFFVLLAKSVQHNAHPKLRSNGTSLPQPVALGIIKNKEIAMSDLTFSNDELREDLSKTELKYLPMLGAGMTKREMAEKLCRSEATVNSHIKNIQAKLGASNGPSIVARAIAKGLLKVSLTAFLFCLINLGDNDVRRPSTMRRNEQHIYLQGTKNCA